MFCFTFIYLFFSLFKNPVLLILAFKMRYIVLIAIKTSENLFIIKKSIRFFIAFVHIILTNGLKRFIKKHKHYRFAYLPGRPSNDIPVHLFNVNNIYMQIG